MQIGHSGRTRPLELIVATVLLIIAVRIAIPLPSTVYTNYVVKGAFSALVGFPALWLLFARAVSGRKRALLGVLITYVYSGLLALAVDWTRFGTAAALLGLAGVASYLYFVTAREAAWIQAGSSPSSPPEPPSSGGSSSG